MGLKFSDGCPFKRLKRRRQRHRGDDGIKAVMKDGDAAGNDAQTSQGMARMAGQSQEAT